MKTAKYPPLLNNIRNRGWNVDMLMVIIAGAQATTHTHSLNTLHDTLKISQSEIKQTCININTIAIQHAMSILLHKRQLKDNQPLPEFQDTP
jgi:hypothetical protein